MARSKRIHFLGALLGTLVGPWLAPSASHASGLFFSDRGVRPLGRGGAFVAGADDLGAVWYNPAGIADAGNALLADFSWLNYSADYTRQTRVFDSAGTARTFTYPTVEGTSPFLPLPTLAGSMAFGKSEEFVIAGSLLAPYTPLTTFPETIDGQPAPSRYSLRSLEGSALVEATLHASYKPIEQIRVGIGVGALVGTFASTVVFSAAPADRLISAPEDPNYDALSRLKVGPIVSPVVDGGIILVPHRYFRLGVSARLPTKVQAPATVDVRLPSAAVFDRARQVGNEADVTFALPAIFRAGLELRPMANLRMEASFVREFWTTHRYIDVTPKNISLYDIAGFPSPFYVSPIALPRRFDNANSYRFGAEYTHSLGDKALTVRSGVSYDESAIPSDYVSPLTIDNDKVLLGLGASFHLGETWRFDAMYSHTFAGPKDVDPATAAIPRVNPVKGNPTATESINGGTYRVSANLLGLGMQYKF